jgi:hypothetical protein
MNRNDPEIRYVVCIRNTGYETSLELRKIYQAISDPTATAQGLVRVIDESGEDYLYPNTYFVEIQVPAAVEKVFSQAA